MPPDKARFVGEPVAVVVAETVDQAKDAAELIEIAYEPLPAVVRAADALKPDAPRLWDDAPDNLCVDIEVGDEAAAAEAFGRAAPIVRLDTWVQRVTGVPMEPRTTTADYDSTTGNYTLYAGSGPWRRQTEARPRPGPGCASRAGTLRVPGHGREFWHAEFLLS
jgi:carbon-monoxide dehydrogenase large subunit